MRAGLAQVVQQVEVEVTGAGADERLVKARLGLFLAGAVDPRGALGGKLVALARVALHKRLPDGVFAALVGPGGVEVGEAGAEEHVDHLLGLLDVDGALLALCLGLQPWQAHEAESELLDVCAELGLRCAGGHGVLSRLPWVALGGPRAWQENSAGRVHKPGG